MDFHHFANLYLRFREDPQRSRKGLGKIQGSFREASYWYSVKTREAGKGRGSFRTHSHKQQEG